MLPFLVLSACLLMLTKSFSQGDSTNGCDHNRSAPDIAPYNFTSKSVNAITLLLSWDDLKQCKSGLNIQYNVSCNRVDRPTKSANVTGIRQGVRRANLSGLRVDTSYRCFVLAFNKAGYGPNASVDAKTMKHEIITILNVTSRNVTVKFDTSHTYVKVTFQNLTYYRLSCTNASGFTTVDIRNKNDYIITDLQPYQLHGILVRKLSVDDRENCSQVYEVRTKEDIPSAPPQEVTVTVLSSSSLSITWSAVPLEQRNGKIVGYEINLRDKDTNESIQIKNESQFTVQKDNLKKYHNYSIRIAANTSVGRGNYSSWVENRTLEDIPSAPPQEVTVTVLSSSSLSITWSAVPLEQRNGKIVGYELNLRDKDTNESFQIKNESQFTLRKYHLKKYHNYSIRVAANTSVGRGNYSSWVENRTLEDIPSAPPQEVTVTVLSSSSLSITWSAVPLEQRNGKIVGYEINLRDKDTNKFLQIKNESQFTLQKDNLKKYHNYSIRIAANTSVGRGNYSSWVENRTLEDIPSAPPQEVTITVLSSSSLSITWSAVPLEQRNGKIVGYEINRRDKDTNESIQIKNESQFIFQMDKLKKYHNYSIRVAANTSVGRGIYSSWVENRTFEDIPDGAPSITTQTSVTVTSITVQWKPISLARINGVLLGYRLNYSVSSVSQRTRRKRNTAERKDKLYSITVGPNELRYEIKNLTVFTSYDITVNGYNSKGSGPFTRHIPVTTGEDVPSKPPINVRAVDHGATTSLEVKWDDIPIEHLRGKLTGYQIRYRAIEQGEEEITSQIYKRDIPANVNKFNITGLETYTRYEIRLLAKTSVGNGVWSDKVFGETCRCNQKISTNWWNIAPYMGITANNSLIGVFSYVLKGMVDECCQVCHSNKTSTLDLFSMNAGKSDATFFTKRSLQDVKNNISENNDLSFPLYGQPEQVRFGSIYGFIPIVISPGEALVVNRVQGLTLADIVCNSVVNSWPIIYVLFVFSILAGFIMWFLEFRANPECFPENFLAGLNNGIWWAYVSCTTVGYGDRTMKTIAGRAFAIVTTLIGLIIISILTSTITQTLTSNALTIDGTLYGKRIAAIKNSPQYNFAIRRNAKVDKVVCLNVKDIVSALKTKQVDGLIVDTYVAGANKELFSEFFRVRKIFEGKSAYGVALAGDAMKLQRCFTRYIKANKALIYKEIDKVVESIKEPTNSEIVDRLTTMYDPNSKYVTISILCSAIVLGVLTVIGLCYELVRRKRKRKVGPLSVLGCKRNQLDEYFGVKAFVTKMKKLNVELRRKHKQELQLLTRLKKAACVQVIKKVEGEDI